ncbi:MAG: histidine phosphatase family protein [Nanoarchaeota archaeon]
MRLLLVRHGETEENKAGIIQGWLPGKLTPLGIKQAQQLAKRLKWLKIDYAFSSDLTRCVDTTQEILKYHLKTKLTLDKRIRERNLGIFQGTKRNKSDWEALPDEGNEYFRTPEGGESFAEVQKGVKKFLKELIKEHSQDTILVVTHGGTLIVFRSLLEKKDISDLIQPKVANNTGLSEYEVNSKGQVKMVCFNCDKHLK